MPNRIGSVPIKITCLNRAIGTAGLSPAGLRPCRLLRSPEFRCEPLNDPLWSTTPARCWHTRRYHVQQYWLPSGIPLGPMQLVKFRGLLPSLSLWLIIRLSLSFAYLVTLIYIKFSSGPVANLWLGWIVQLIHSSLPRRTHHFDTTNVIFHG